MRMFCFVIKIMWYFWWSGEEREKRSFVCEFSEYGDLKDFMCQIVGFMEMIV